MPTGTLAVGVGLVLSGLTTYLFLVVAKRVLPDDGADKLAAIWGVVFAAGPGFFLPLEQEISRAIASRRAQNVGFGPVVRRAAMLGGMLVALLLVLVTVFSPFIVDHLFGGQWLLWLALALSSVSFFCGHLVRGVISGRGQFWLYSTFIGGESVARLLMCIVLAVVGVEVAGGYGLAIALAPLFAFALVAPTQRNAFQPGPPAPWNELSQSLGALLAGSVLAQGLANASLIVVNPLAGEAQESDVSRLFSGVIVARLPLFLFQAVQAALLPKLSAMAGARHYHDFRHQLTRLVEAVIGIGILGVIGGFILGPFVVDLLFDAEMGHTDMAILAAGTACYIVAMSLAQALIAIEGQNRMAIGWLLGAITFAVVLFLEHDLLRRIEYSAFAGSAVAAAAMAVFTAKRLKVVEAIEDALVAERASGAGPAPAV